MNPSEALKVDDLGASLRGYVLVKGSTAINYQWATAYATAGWHPGRNTVCCEGGDIEVGFVGGAGQQPAWLTTGGRVRSVAVR